MLMKKALVLVAACCVLAHNGSSLVAASTDGDQHDQDNNNVRIYPAHAPFTVAIESHDYNRTMTAGMVSYCSYAVRYGNAECSELLSFLEIKTITNSTNQAVGMVAVDDKHERIYVGFAGTEAIPKDYFVDADIIPVATDLPHIGTHTIRAHQGFYDRMNGYYETIKRVFGSVPEQKRNNYEIVFCGHSAGGALTLLTSFRIYTDFGYDIFGGPNNSINQFKWVTFGMPRTLTPASEFFGRDENHLRFMNTEDIVPNLLYGIFEHTGIKMAPNDQKMRDAYATFLDPKTAQAPLLNLLLGKGPSHEEAVELERYHFGDNIVTFAADYYIVDTQGSVAYAYLSVITLSEAQDQYLDSEGTFIPSPEATSR